MISTVNIARVMRYLGLLLALAVFFEGVGVKGADGGRRAASRNQARSSRLMTRKTTRKRQEGREERRDAAAEDDAQGEFHDGRGHLDVD